MGRFLIYFSYIGTGFSGMQIQTNKPFKTVVSVFQEALNRLDPANQPSHLVTSSRTDKGVHALCNTGHVDLIHRDIGTEYNPALVTSLLNKTFLEFKEDIRVLKTLRVADNFHSRFLAATRTYVYRICVARNPDLGWGIPYPPFEFRRSYMIRQPLNLDMVREAARIMSGTHDFKGFTVPSSLEKQPWVNSVKSIQVDVLPGRGFLQEHVTSFGDEFDHWNLVFKSHSFLYRQVRKMTAILIAVGLGHVNIDEVRQLIENCEPIRKSNIYNIPAYGLYLTDVEYNREDLYQAITNTSGQMITDDSTLRLADEVQS